MVETSKQVRVDNWGIYFLQRLQLFFSKTDYCDLTLQFEGNVQLKVHRLVMNACTEYFAFLEQTSPALEENTILMPPDLQADVIVPIVNFMYTGMLEFHPSIYDRLYRAAEIMNIAVLTKLLEAQLAPISKMTARRGRERDVAAWKEAKKTPKPAAPPIVNDLPDPPPAKKVPAWKKRNPLVNSSHHSHSVSGGFTSSKWSSAPTEIEPPSFVDNTPKPTRFEWPEEELAPVSSMYSSFDDVSLTSKPLWTKEDDHKPVPAEEPLKVHQYYSKRNSNSVSQNNEEELIEREEKVEVLQMEETPVEIPAKRKAESKAASSPKRVKITNNEEETVISITTSNPNEVDHTQLVSEILKKYPDLVKKKKNIKLKITQSKTEPTEIKVQTTRAKSKQQLPLPVEKAIQPLKETKRELQVVKENHPPSKDSPNRKSKNAIFRAASDEGPWTCMECFDEDRQGAEFVLYYLFRKHMADQHNIEFDATLCKYCGKKCPKQNLMVYHLYTKHGLKPPRDVTFPKCSSCPFIAPTPERMEEHVKTHGKDEVQCKTCHLGFLTNKDFLVHQQLSGHNNKSASILDCAYCLKKLQSPVTLFTHVRSQHMKEARRDGVTSLNESMDIESEEVEERSQEETVAVPVQVKTAAEVIENRVEDKQGNKERVKIISNVKVARQEDNVPTNGIAKDIDPTPLQKPEPETVAVTTAATALSNIGGSLATNLGLVDIVVLDDNQQYILQQPQGQPGSAEFILPHDLSGSEGILQAAAASGELNSTDELVMVLTDHDYQDEQNQGTSDNSNIVVLYSHPVEGQQGQFITSQGNLLVNSEGMLEIRNGTAITTTAGQILVNSDNTTTTQATESPVESIDMIRREIERDDFDHGKESIKTVLSKKDKECEIEKELRPSLEETNEHRIEVNMDSDYHDAKNDVSTALDTTDSSTQDEPMEVDEIVPDPKDCIEEKDKEENEKIVPPSPEIEQSQSIEQQEIEQQKSIDQRESIEEQRCLEQSECTEEPSNEKSTTQQHGQDVPPDIERSPQVNQQVQESHVSNPRVNLIMNDPNNFQIPPAVHNVEQMEVDGGGLDESGENKPSLDEVDNKPLENAEESSDIENAPQVLTEKPSQENDNEEFQDQRLQEGDTNQEQEKINEDDYNQSAEVNQGESNENLVQPQEESNTAKDLSENSGQNQEETAQNVEAQDGEVVLSKNNTQATLHDLSNESQHSPGQKTHKDLNKEILDDWDDTDSQQSQSQEQDNQEQASQEDSQEQDSQETEQDQTNLNAAAENVNKLMDDWDEEDEEQNKE